MKEPVDYKKKYQDLRARFVGSLDMAFRMGYEQGANEATMQAQAQQAQAAMQQAQNAQAQVGAMGGGAPQDDQAMMDADQAAGPQDPSMQAPGGISAGQAGFQPVPPQSEELDGYISELEGLVSKSEVAPEALKKSIEKIKNFQMNTKLAKSMKGLGFSKRAAKNLSPSAKKDLSLQEQVLDNIMAKWEKEAPRTVSDAMQVIGTEALSKKE